jgi:TPP-dependent pyruvate/acetoin dehydrogenase alpha subunit
VTAWQAHQILDSARDALIRKASGIPQVDGFDVWEALSVAMDAADRARAPRSVRADKPPEA